MRVCPGYRPTAQEICYSSVGGREGVSVVCGALNPLKEGSDGKREREGESAKRKKVDERWMTGGRTLL